MAATPGITPTPDGYTFNWVYTGSEANSPTGGQVAGDFTGTGPTRLFGDDITLNSGTMTNGIDSRLVGTDNTGLVFRPSFQYSTGYFKGAPLTVRDTDGVVDSTRDPEGQKTTAPFQWTHGGVSPARYIPAGSDIAVRGTITFSLLDNNDKPVPGVTVTGYVLATVNSNGTYNNFGLAMDQQLEALVTKYGLSQIKLKVTGTTGPTPIPVCFSADTLIETDRGPVRAGDLAVGDLVETRDNGLQPIRWINSRRFALMPSGEAGLRPIRIKAGALGPNTPAQDLLVSPQHRVLVRSKIAQKMFGTDEILVSAKQLLQVEGIDVAEDLTEVTYVHFLFDQHEIVFSNGAETESLFTGPEALKTVGAAARDEIFVIFPELRDMDYTPEPARPLASGRMGRKLAVRHMQNGKALVQ